MSFIARRVLGLGVTALLLAGVGGCNKSVSEVTEKAWADTKALPGKVGEGIKDLHNKVWHTERPAGSPLTGSEAIDREAYDKLGYALQWSAFAAFDKGEGKAAAGNLANVDLLGDLLVVADDTTMTTALTTGSGQPKWSAVLADRATKFNRFTRVGSHIMATDSGTALLVNAESGALEARQHFDRLSSTAPVTLGDLLVMGSGEYLFAHMMRTGHDAWTYRTPAPVRVDPVYVGGTSVAFVSVDGSVMIIDAATGTMNGVGKTWGDAGGKPAAGDGAVFVASLDQSLYAFNVDGGGQRWRIRTQEPIDRAPAYYHGSVYVHVPGTGMIAVNSGNGNQLWKNGAIVGDVFAARKGNLIAWDKETATATLIDAGNGDIMSTVKLPNVGRIVTSAFGDGDWYVVSERGEVSKFAPKN